MCLGDFTSSRKTRRMQIPVLLEFSFKSAFRNKRTDSRCICLVFGILWNARPGEFLKLFVHKGTQQLACLDIIPSGCSLCPPPPRQSHKYARAQFGSQAITLFLSGLQLNRCVPPNDPKNNYGIQFGLTPILVSKVVIHDLPIVVVTVIQKNMEL